MFSEELRILDNNTVKYMVDQLEEEIKNKDAALPCKHLDVAVGNVLFIFVTSIYRFLFRGILQD